jgi:hypothetical protein
MIVPFASFCTVVVLIIAVYGCMGRRVFIELPILTTAEVLCAANIIGQEIAIAAINAEQRGLITSLTFTEVTVLSRMVCSGALRVCQQSAPAAPKTQTGG